MSSSGTTIPDAEAVSGADADLLETVKRAAVKRAAVELKRAGVR